MSPEATYVLESLATVTLFGGALWLATVALRRASGGGVGTGPLEIVARQPLDARRAIYLVRVGKRVLVVGASDGALTRLGSTTMERLKPELDAAPRPTGLGARFGAILGRVSGPTSDHVKSDGSQSDGSQSDASSRSGPEEAQRSTQNSR